MPIFCDTLARASKICSIIQVGLVLWFDGNSSSSSGGGLVVIVLGSGSNDLSQKPDVDLKCFKTISIEIILKLLLIGHSGPLFKLY